jgi:hypothetical protein
VPESVAPNIRNRSYTIAVEADIATTDASEVMFSHGARFGGHALCLKDGKLKYVYNWVGMLEQIIESTDPMTSGHQILSATFGGSGLRDRGCKPRRMAAASAFLPSQRRPCAGAAH